MIRATVSDIEALRAALAVAEARAEEAVAKASNAEAIIAALKLMVEKLRREIYGQRSERKARLLDQLELELEELEARASEDELAAEQAAAKTSTVKSFTRRRPSRKPFPEHLPRERVVVPAPEVCGCCGSDRLSKLGEDITETLEVIPRSWKVVQTVREKFTCRDCEKISQAPAPFHVTPRGWAGPGLLAMILFEKYGQHQPLNRQSERYGREGVALSLSTLNALFLKDLALKTRRGLEGRVRQGFSGGGNAYGYDVVRETDASGEPLRGKRRINEAEAAIVRRIFEEFTAGRSPKIIAHALNHEHVPAPAGKDWGPSTIYGNWRRGTGIINNELYIGRLVWNRQRYIKDPKTGKRQARMNPKSEWIMEAVPHLRIINDEIWERVKQRQEKTRFRIIKGPGNIRSEKARRPRYLLSGLIKCGECGGGFSMNGANRYACSTAHNKGTCSNRLSIRRDTLEGRVLDGLRKELMHPDLVKAFIDEFHREVNRLAAERDIDRDHLIRDLEKTNRDLKRIVQAIKDGIPALTLKDELMELEARKLELGQMVSKAPAPIPRLHPRLADLYRHKVDDLHAALNREDTRAEAAEAIRDLIDEIRLVLEDGELKIELFGELAALIGLANKNPQSGDRGLQVTLVAGARNHLNLLFDAPDLFGHAEFR